MLLEKNDLIIEDLGCFNIDRFKQIAKRRAYFLSRFRFGRVVFKKHKDEYVAIDLLKEEKKMKSGEIRQFQVWIDRKEKLPVRLILEKCRIKSQIKRRKLKTDKQNKRKNISRDRLRFCNLNAYITNTSQEELPMENARNYYSLRWQIEIIFKAWKSVYTNRSGQINEISTI
ncbi:MAG: transposase [Bacteroidetes bacterium]|nr:transposase [Bacteroidota bacterium]